MAFVLEPSRVKSIRPCAELSPPRRARDLNHLLSTAAIDSDDVDGFCEAAEAFESVTGEASAAPERLSRFCSFSPARARVWDSKRPRSVSAHMRSGWRTCLHRAPTAGAEKLSKIVLPLFPACATRWSYGIMKKGPRSAWLHGQKKPVINAGDGWNEHPTQALIDIFALRRGLGSIRGKSIALAGDPRGRTVRSLSDCCDTKHHGKSYSVPPPNSASPTTCWSQSMKIRYAGVSCTTSLARSPTAMQS